MVYIWHSAIESTISIMKHPKQVGAVCVLHFLPPFGLTKTSDEIWGISPAFLPPNGSSAYDRYIELCGDPESRDLSSHPRKQFMYSKKTHVRCLADMTASEVTV
jgi:hypothetical protein